MAALQVPLAMQCPPAGMQAVLLSATHTHGARRRLQLRQRLQHALPSPGCQPAAPQLPAEALRHQEEAGGVLQAAGQLLAAADAARRAQQPAQARSARRLLCGGRGAGGGFSSRCC